MSDPTELSPPGHAAGIQAGVARIDITPEEPVVMSGYGHREGRSTGVHDPLYATTLVLDDGARRVAVVSIDVLNVSREMTHRVSSRLARRGVDLDALFFAATHTHAGPYLPARALDVSPVLQVDEDVSPVAEKIEDLTVRSIEEAVAGVEDATIRYGRTQIDDVAQNRRAAGGVSGNVRVPYGPVDPEVIVLVIALEGGTEAIVYNFACHPVCTTGDETLLSADWPGCARQEIESVRPDSVALFLNGTAGDINPQGRAEQRSGDAVYAYMEDIGRRVGEGVLAAVREVESPGTQAIGQAPLYIDERRVRLPVKRTPPVAVLRERIAALDAERERLEAAGDDYGRERARFRHHHAQELLAIAEWGVDALPNRIPYVEIGDIGLVGLPGEVHAAHGLEWKRRANIGTLLPIGFVNDYVGYLPTLDQLEHVGYEVRTMKVAPEAVVELREAVLELITNCSPVPP